MNKNRSEHRRSSFLKFSSNLYPDNLYLPELYKNVTQTSTNNDDDVYATAAAAAAYNVANPAAYCNDMPYYNRNDFYNTYQSSMPGHQMPYPSWRRNTNKHELLVSSFLP